MTRHVSLLCSLKKGTDHPPCSGTCDGHGTGRPCNRRCKCRCHRAARAHRAGIVVVLAFAAAALAANVLGAHVYRWESCAWPPITAAWVLLYWQAVSRETSRRRPGWPGIRLRITDRVVGAYGRPGELVEADSEQLHYIAKFGALEHAGRGWYEIFPGDHFTAAVGLVVEVMPVMLGGDATAAPRARPGPAR